MRIKFRKQLCEWTNCSGKQLKVVLQPLGIKRYFHCVNDLMFISALEANTASGVIPREKSTMLLGETRNI